MPRLSQWFVRAAFIYLLLGFTLGALLLTNKGIPFSPALWNWLPVHIEFLLVGWIVQLAMGVGFWIMPRYWTKPRRPHERYAQIALLLLNLGIWAVVAYVALGLASWLLFLGRALEVAAAIFFARHAWRRVVSREGA